MGNKKSCCFVPSDGGIDQKKKVEEKYKTNHKETRYNLEPPLIMTTSASNVQHISEREPEDCQDPSNDPVSKTLFAVKGERDPAGKNHRKNSCRRKSQYDNHVVVHPHSGKLRKKYSSCSTIYIDDSTVTQPNLKNTIKAVALAVYLHIKNRSNEDEHNLDMDDEIVEIFNEKVHPLTRDSLPTDYCRKDPEHKTIYRFIRTLFNAAQLTAECAIVTLVYLERLLAYAELELGPLTWKRALLGAITLASKVWDDQAVWNIDYCQILKDVSVEDMNELERQFLELLQFNINVPASVYAKYYFELRTLADEHDLSFPLELLSKERAIKLEAMSNNCEDKLKCGLKRSVSVDGAMNKIHTRAILS